MTYVLGTLAELELSLRHRANAKSPTMIAQLGGRVAALNGKLAKIAGVAPVIAEVPPLRMRIDATFGRLFVSMPDDQKYYADFAAAVSDAAKNFSKSHDGSKLDGLDAAVQAIPAKGTVFRP